MMGREVYVTLNEGISDIATYVSANIGRTLNTSDIWLLAIDENGNIIVSDSELYQAQHGTNKVKTPVASWDANSEIGRLYCGSNFSNLRVAIGYDEGLGYESYVVYEIYPTYYYPASEGGS